MARRKTQTYGVASVAGRGGRLAARQLRAILPTTGPRFRALTAAAGRTGRLAGSSASSWQGLVVDPGGARRRPSARLASQARGTPHPPRLTTPRETPLQKDEVDTA